MQDLEILRVNELEGYPGYEGAWNLTEDYMGDGGN